MENLDYIVCECALAPLEKFVESLEGHYVVKIARMPGVCLTMIQAEDSVEFQPFYLGEALTTECEVLVNDRIGYGICLGDEPVRSYCMAFLDAVVQLNDERLPAIQDFLTTQAARIEHAAKLEYNQILRTKVDFKLMEQD